MADDSLFRRWPFRACRPDRYDKKYRTYRARGGLLDIEQDVRGYTGGETHSDDIGRFYFFCVAFDQMMKEGVRGDLAELGVYQGRTASLIATMARRMGTTAYLLDTFKGFAREDLSGIDQYRNQLFQDTSLEAVQEAVGTENTRYIQGFFPDTAALMPDDQPFCFVHIDCDLYAPICSALAYFYPRMVPGGYIVVHDYGSLDWNGAERAVDEFFADKPEPVMMLTDRAGSVAVRKARPSGGDTNWYLQRCAALLTSSWSKAGNGRLQMLLYAGWSDAEPWGVWGIGKAHELSLVLDGRPAGDVAVELEVGASLVGSRLSQTASVHVQNETIETWTFTRESNRAARRAVVPARCFSAAGNGFFSALLVLAPEDVRPVNMLDPARDDVRSLGLSFNGLRRVL